MVSEVNQIADRVQRRDPATIRAAQLLCADRALKEPDPGEWLRETLAMLGIGATTSPSEFERNAHA